MNPINGLCFLAFLLFHTPNWSQHYPFQPIPDIPSPSKIVENDFLNPEEHRLIAKHSKFWDPNTQNLISEDSTSYTYTSEGLLNEVLYYLFYQGEFTPFSKTAYTYDNEGMLIEELYQKSDFFTNQILLNEDLRIYEYDNNGNRTAAVLQRWETNQWENLARQEFTYDTDNQLIESQNLGWNNSNWEIGSKHIYLYTDGLLSADTTYSWYMDDWLFVHGNSYEYDANGNLTRHIRDFWEWTIGVWRPSKVYEFEYDANDNLIKETEKQWQSSLEEVVNLFQWLYEYDSEGNQIERLYLVWQLDIEEWQEAVRNDYSFSSENLLQTDLAYRWIVDDEAWVLIAEHNYYYESFTNVETATFLSNDLKVFPNPTSQTIFLKIEKPLSRDVRFSIINNQGEKVKEGIMNSIGQQKIDLKDLAPATYFFQVFMNEGVGSKKFIVLR